MKKVGLIGGLSPESTVHYYQYLCREFNKSAGGLKFPQMTLESLNLQELVDCFNVNQWDVVAEKLLGALENLKRTGCDFAVILANTPHNAYEAIKDKSPLPILTIMDATAQALEENKIESVILLGTKATMEYGFFQTCFSGYGIEVVVPDQESRNYLDKLIWEELSHGIINEKSKADVKKIILDLVDCSVGGVVLGCTELEMLIKPEDSPRPVFDTAEIHAKAILNKVMED